MSLILPFHYTSAPARLRLPVPHVSTRPLNSSLSLHAKIPFYIWNERIKYCNRYYHEVNWSVLHVNVCVFGYKIVIFTFKVNWNVLMCKFCIARRLIVDIFPWCNANFVPFPSWTLVARPMQNGSNRKLSCKKSWLQSLSYTPLTVVLNTYTHYGACGMQDLPWFWESYTNVVPYTWGTITPGYL